MLIDRERELDELNAVLRAPSARLVAVSGRRRLGKTTLLVHWAKTSEHPYLYWVSSRLPSSLLLQQFSQRVWQHGHPGERAPRTFSYEDWSEALEELARTCQVKEGQDGRRHIVILDEFPYAVASEPGLPSILQNAWDHHLKFSNVCMVLCGSHVGMMESLVNADAPLYGRMVGPLRVGPLPFSATAAFFPSYSAEQRVAVYAVLGGVPAYLELFSDALSLGENIKQNLFRETGLFRSDPNALIGEQVRDLDKLSGGPDRHRRRRAPAGGHCPGRRVEPSLQRRPLSRPPGRDGLCALRTAGHRSPQAAPLLAPRPLRLGRQLFALLLSLCPAQFRPLGPGALQPGGRAHRRTTARLYRHDGL